MTDYRYFILQAIAGYDNGLDPRQPRDIKVRQYSKEVKRFVVKSIKAADDSRMLLFRTLYQSNSLY